MSHISSSRGTDGRAEEDKMFVAIKGPLSLRTLSLGFSPTREILSNHRPFLVLFWPSRVSDYTKKRFQTCLSGSTTRNSRFITEPKSSTVTKQLMKRPVYVKSGAFFLASRRNIFTYFDSRHQTGKMWEEGMVSETFGEFTGDIGRPPWKPSLCRPPLASFSTFTVAVGRRRSR